MAAIINLQKIKKNCGYRKLTDVNIIAHAFRHYNLATIFIFFAILGLWFYTTLAKL